MKLFFWQKFSRYLLIGLSAMVLLAGGRQMVLGDLQRGPNAVLAEDDNCLDPSFPGCEEPGFGGEIPPAPPPPVGPPPGGPPPGQPPPPSGGQCTPVFQYNECIDCNTSRPVYTNSCSGAFSTGPNQSDGACSYLCAPQPQPQPQPGPSCP
ncbi:hypothetical protein HY384_01370, partial [Candidatus Daviesbacteria bacterium]|nr:hypothetical protein [Candidatus Daviesbacteria bacterium]